MVLCFGPRLLSLPADSMADMSSLWNIAQTLLLCFVDCLVALVGHRRIGLAPWPNHEVVKAALSTFREFGAEQLETRLVDLALDVENLYFRVQGRRVRLCIEEYGDLTLWGSRSLVTKIANRINEKLSAEKYESGIA
jgi:hypothetical protein